MSLSRAFKYAGVPNTVMYFWKADDFYTKNIMTHFYQILKKGVGKNEALRQAKIAQINAAKDNKSAAHPFYWANFVLVGDAQPIPFSSINWWIWGCGALFLLVFGVLRWRKMNIQEGIESRQQDSYDIDFKFGTLKYRTNY